MDCGQTWYTYFMLYLAHHEIFYAKVGKDGIKDVPSSNIISQCQTLHSDCPGILFKHTLRPSGLHLYMLCSSDFDIKLRSKVGFPAAVIAASVKHCTVIVLGILF